MADRLWFVTGAGRGLGRAFAEVALEHGDRVVGTVRQHGVLDDLASVHGPRLHLRVLDVADRAQVHSVVTDVVAEVGVPDVVVNNAGYGLVGAAEELSEAAIRGVMDVDFFGPLWVSQAVAPHLRERGSGHIVQISTVGAAGHLALFGGYNAAKWALEGLSSAMADELAPFGIRVHLLQLGGFDTDWAGSSMRFGDPAPAYDELRTQMLGDVGYGSWDTTGSTDQDPRVAAEALLTVLDLPDPPLRNVVGKGAHELVRAALEQRRDDYRKDPGFVWPG